MSIVVGSEEGPTPRAEAAFYPPTVEPAAGLLPLYRFIPRFIRNPLRSLPRAVYEEPLVVHAGAPSGLAWVTAPALVERILLHEADDFPKTPLEKRVFEPILGDGILTSQGHSWRWQRRTAAPLFRYQDLVAQVPAIATVGEERLALWRTGPPVTHQIDREMADVTYDVFTHTLLAGAPRADGEILKRRGAEFLSRISWEIAWAMLRLPGWVWHPAKGSMRRSAEAMRAATERIIARRRAEKGEPGRDILGRLLATRDPETGQPMSDAQVADNLLTFIAAGHETTAKALTWTLYLLARAPRWQASVRAEVTSVCGSGRVAARDLDKLAVTTRVLKESMRLYPPAPVLTRSVGRDLDIGGHRLKRGALIIMPIYAIHRHRALWEDPDRFDPDRFLPEAEASHLRTQFMPFGFGPRTCIGMAFAMLEATALLATLVRGARFDWDGRHSPEPVTRVTLQPKGGMPLLVTPL
jgi:cytochrome P450